MRITKIFKVECSHRVRNCTTDRCQGLHGHSYKIELTFEGDPCNQANMVMDFSVLKEFIKPFIDSFDHTHMFCTGEPKEYTDFMRNTCNRWISAPFNWSCEMMALMIFAYVQRMIDHTNFSNEEDPMLVAVKVWETETGNCLVDALDVNDFWKIGWFDKIVFSEGITKDWPEELSNHIYNYGNMTTKKVDKFIEVESFNRDCYE